MFLGNLRIIGDTPYDPTPSEKPQSTTDSDVPEIYQSRTVTRVDRDINFIPLLDTTTPGVADDAYRFHHERTRQMKNIDINQVKYLYYQEKKSASEIARVFDCDPATIYVHMKKNGMQRRSASESQKIRYNNRVYDKHRSESELAEMVRLYFEEYLSLAEVGKRLRVSHSTVRERLLTAGYQIRKIGEAGHLRKSGGRIYTEAELSEMKRLYCEEELSSAEIARRFDCTDVTIRTHLEQQGVRLRTLKEAQALRRKKEAEKKKMAEVHHIPNCIPKEQVTPARILQLRNEENLTIDAIAERCSLSNLEVYNILEEMGGI